MFRCASKQYRQCSVLKYSQTIRLILPTKILIVKWLKDKCFLTYRSRFVPMISYQIPITVFFRIINAETAGFLVIDSG